jgi:hypothetical protein
VADTGLALLLLNTGLVATNAFSQSADATPIGMLNLERLEMTPAGIERGELLATICLAPLEQTAVVQKEWSVTTKEFTSIVTDSLENYSETGVTENTELAQSTTSQTQHSNQFNVSATVTGSYGFVTVSGSTGYQAQDQKSDSATASAKHAIATTKKASSRVKQEHKVTISTTTVAGTSETTTRTLQNPSQTNPMRIDYFSLMRKWHVGLYRYGLRLTYDIVIPEPGAALREAYMQLANFQAQAAQGFSLPIRISDVTRSNWQDYASQFQVNVPEPPADAPEITFPPSSYTAQDQGSYSYSTITLDLPEGYVVSSATLTADQVVGNDPNWPIPGLQVMHLGDVPGPSNPSTNWDRTASLDFLVGLSGRQYVVYGVISSPSGVVEIDVQLQLSADAFAAWQQQVWNALYTAAQNTYYATQQALQAQIQALQDRLNSVDTLTLRREENDEIMKGVLRWLLGPGFEFMPDGVKNLFESSGAAHPEWGISFPGNQLGLSMADWSTVMNYEQMVRFINDAIDWDNVLYFLYSYFWDVPDGWDNIRNIQHPDATRQAFLRAGSARVVLTVRKGWETAWVQFVEGGTFGSALPQLHPYLTIAQEIQDYDNANYPGIPAANPGTSPDDGDYVATTSGDKVASSSGPVNLSVRTSDGFQPGFSAVIDSWDSGVQETQAIIAIPDAKHITLKALANAHDGSVTPFAVRRAGEKGLLIAEWFEYTPTSGTDIAVTSNLGSIA